MIGRLLDKFPARVVVPVLTALLGVVSTQLYANWRSADAALSAGLAAIESRMLAEEMDTATGKQAYQDVLRRLGRIESKSDRIEDKIDVLVNALTERGRKK